MVIFLSHISSHTFPVANTTQSVRETAVGKTEKAPELRCSLRLNSVLKSALDENVQQECICQLFIAKVIDLKDHPFSPTLSTFYR